MNGCNEVQAGFTEYLGRPVERTRDAGDRCASRGVPRVCAGVEVAARIAGFAGRPGSGAGAGRPAAAHSGRGQPGAGAQPPQLFTAWGLAWKNTVGPFLLQAGAGFASAVLLLGTVVVLVTMFAQPETAQATPDEPLGNATAPRLLYFSNAPGNNDAAAISSPVVVEAYVNGEGEVYDYRIVSGPTDAATRSQVENLLLFSRFEPARFFGQPVRGLAVLSFSGVSVRG